METKTNRNPIKQWSITFPQCGEVTKEAFLASLPPCEDSFCAREEHKEGGFHLHAGVKLKKGLTKIKLIEWLKAKYPDDWKRIHVTATRSLKQWKDYCKKEDPKVVEQHEMSDKLKRIKDEIEEWIREAGPPPMKEYHCHKCRRDYLEKYMWIIPRKGVSGRCIDCGARD